MEVEHGSFIPLVFLSFVGNVAFSYGLLLKILLTEEKNLKVRSVHG